MKKRLFATFLVIVFLLPTFCYADIITIDTDTVSYDELVSALAQLQGIRTQMLKERAVDVPAIEPTSTILFRNIPWFTTYRDVTSIVGDNRSGGGVSTYPEGGGAYEVTFCVAIRGLTVAGYTATTWFSYVYPAVDNVLLKERDLGMLYMAKYELNNLGDKAAAVADITSKLVSLYGEYKQRSTNVLEWSDEEGNKIVLKDSNSECSLLYYSGNANIMIQTAEDALNAEKIEQEELNRLQNVNNTDGL